MTNTEVVPALFDQVTWERARGRHARTGLLQRHRAAIVVATCLVAIATYRITILGIRGTPTGVDFGNWLFFGHQTLGQTLAGVKGSTYPPLVPLLAVAMTSLIGPTWANALLMGVAGICPSLGLWFATRRNITRWAPLPAVLLLACTSSTGEAVAWGGAPQLIGFGAAIAAVGLAARLIEARRLSTAVKLGLLLLLVGATSHLVLAQLALTLVFLLVLAVATHREAFASRSWQGHGGWLACGAVAAVPLLLLAPLYVRLLSTVGSSVANQQQVARGWPSFEAFLSNLWVVYRDTPMLWQSLLVLTAIAPIVLLRARKIGVLWLCTTAIVASLALQALLSAQDRLVFLAPIAVAFALTLWIEEIATGRVHLPGGTHSAVAVVLTIGLATGFGDWNGLRTFPRQRDFYGALVPKGSMTGLEWLRTNTGSDALVLVAPINGAPFGWWAQGYAQRPALVATQDRWLNFPEERRRANRAVALLSTSNVLSDEVFAAAREDDIDYFVLPWAWGGLSRTQLATFRARLAPNVVFDDHALVIIKVPS